MEIINQKINESVEVAIEESINQNQLYLATFLNKFIHNHDEKIDKKINYLIENRDGMKNLSEKNVRVLLLCNWTSSEKLCEQYCKLTEGNFRWKNIKIVSSLPADYYVVFNMTQFKEVDLKKTILFRMEPNMHLSQNQWGWWSNPDKKLFLFAGYHEDYYNNLEHHLSKTYTELLTETIEKNRGNIISSVVSEKYYDPGHKKRIDFLKFLESKNVDCDIFGSNKFSWKSYKGSLPVYCKDDGLLPYKYTFNVENNSINNYVTEKLIDGIMSECLTFYSGCKNIRDIIDDRAYVYLELEDFDNDLKIIMKMIEEDEWSKRIDVIRKEKIRILNELQLFPRIKKIIDADINQK